MEEKRFSLLKILNAVTYVIMIIINILANTIPLNDITTGEVSDAYPNLFAPAPYAFLIWGLIYFLLALFILYSFGLLFRKMRCPYDAVKRIGWTFIISSIANALWIFAWHYNQIFLSMVLMIVILLSLIFAYEKITSKPLTRTEKLFVQLPFSIYLGWITVATIANITTWLVSIGVPSFSPFSVLLTILVLIVGLIIAVTFIRKNKDLAYGLTILWAYIAILVNHISKSGFNKEYPIVIIILSVCIGILIFYLIETLKSKK